MGKVHNKIKAKNEVKGKKVAICIPSRGEMEIGTAFDLAVMCAYDSRHREGHQAIYTVAGTLIFDQREKLAKVQGSLQGDKFVVTYFELLKP